MTNRRLATLLAVAVLGAAALVPLACGGDGGGGSSTPELTPQQARDPLLVTGREVYVNNCASCHGADGGGAAGLKLSEGAVAENLTLPEQIEVITDGRGAMPNWEGDLTPEEIEGVARFEREVL